MTAVIGTDISYGTPSSGATGISTNTLTFAHNSVVGVGDVLIAQATMTRQAGTISSVTATYGGVSMTRLFQYGNTTGIYIAQFILANPLTGSNNVVFTYVGGSGYIAGAACTFYGVNQNSPYYVSSPTNATGNSTAPSVNVPSLPAGLVVDCLGWPIDTDTVTVNSSQAQIVQQGSAGTNGLNAMSCEVGTGSNVAMSWSASASRTWYTGGVCLFPMPRGGGAMISPMLIG